MTSKRSMAAVKRQLKSTGDGRPPVKRWLHMSTAIAATISMLACGLFQRNPEPVDDSQKIEPATETVAEPTVEQSEPTQRPRPLLVCGEPAPQEIGIGATTSGVIQEPDWIQCYWVQLPEGLEQVSFDLTGLEADLSVEMGYGYLVTVQSNAGEFWDSREPETTDENITLEQPKGGPYFIKVQPAGPRVSSPFYLSVHTQPDLSTSASGDPLPVVDSCGGPAIDLELGASAMGQIIGRPERPLNRAYYCVQVPEGLVALNLQVDVLLESVDVFVRKERPAKWYDRDRSDDKRRITIEDPAPGPYYIDIEASSPGISPQFSITVSPE